MIANRFEHVAVLKGGPSAERDVSLASGAAVARALRQLGYDVKEVDLQSTDVQLPGGIDAVFIALHGTFGEDGKLQEVLTRRGIPYTGSDAESSHRSFDKVVSKRIFEQQGIRTPRYEVLRRGEARTLPLPVVVKPPRQGSSIGVTIVHEEADWDDALAEAFKLDEEVLVEAYIAGRELTVGIVGEQVLPVIEIRAPEGNYNYRAKYTKGMTEYHVPAPIGDEATRACQDMAWRAFAALGCRGMARVDIRMAQDGTLYVLELNTIPGFTETSLLPKAARAAGIEFPELCQRILNLAALS
jgi:D-alanine-D-alanine ligase